MAPFSTPEKVHCTAAQGTLSPAQSLGSGCMSVDGYVSFSSSSPLNGELSRKSVEDLHGIAPSSLSSRFLRRYSAFLRVADLGIDAKASITTEESNEEPHPNYHHPSCEPPPGVEHDPKEQWIALNDIDGLHAPIAPFAIERLADFGLMTSMNDAMWTPDSKTERLLRERCPSWMKETFKPGKVCMEASKGSETDVLVWTGSFKHGLYGGDLPAIRTAGVVAMSAKGLLDLLVDSSRVKEYNKMSLGRTDLQIFQSDMVSEGPFGKSITKIMKSESKPPMVRKPLVFVSILHAKELIDGSGYLIVSRGVHHPDEQGCGNSEILMGVNLIRKIDGRDDRCVMINVNHIRSALVPMMIAKRIGVAAAMGFINDLRSLC